MTHGSEHLLDIRGFALLHSHRACLDTAFKNKSAELIGVSTWPLLILSKELLDSSLPAPRASLHRGVLRACLHSMQKMW